MSEPTPTEIEAGAEAAYAVMSRIGPPAPRWPAEERVLQAAREWARVDAQGIDAHVADLRAANRDLRAAVDALLELETDRE